MAQSHSASSPPGRRFDRPSQQPPGPAAWWALHVTDTAPDRRFPFSAPPFPALVRSRRPFTNPPPAMPAPWKSQEGAPWNHRRRRRGPRWCSDRNWPGARSFLGCGHRNGGRGCAFGLHEQESARRAVPVGFRPVPLGPRAGCGGGARPPASSTRVYRGHLFDSQNRPGLVSVYTDPPWRDRVGPGTPHWPTNARRAHTHRPRSFRVTDRRRSSASTDLPPRLLPPWDGTSRQPALPDVEVLLNRRRDPRCRLRKSLTHPVLFGGRRVLA